MQLEEFVVRAEDGTGLHGRRYRPGGEPATRHAVIVHGASEHGARYDHICRRMAEAGWEVASIDLRGHGRSEGDRTHVRHFNDYINDLATVTRHFGWPAARTVILGHSMGGLVSVRFAQRYPQHLSAVVLLSPLLGVSVEIPLRTLILGRTVSIFAPRTRFQTRVRIEDTTRTQEVIAHRRVDPLINRSVTAGWFFAMKSAVKQAWRDAPQLQLPILVIQAGQDRIVDPAAPAQWLQQVGSADTEHHLLPDSYHELLNEPEWEETLELILRWLDARVPAESASGASGPADSAARPSAGL